MFATIDQRNAEIERQRGEGNALIVLDADVCQTPKVVSAATKHRIYATLRAAMNAAVKRRLIPSDIYQHVRRASADDAAERVAAGTWETRVNGVYVPRVPRCSPRPS